MNETEISLINKRLKKNLVEMQKEYRKRGNSRNQKAFNKARSTVPVLNKWLYTDQSTKRSEICAKSTITLSVSQAYNLTIQKALSLAAFNIEVDIEHIYSKKSVDELYKSRDGISPSKWIVIRFSYHQVNENDRIIEICEDLNELGIHFRTTIKEEGIEWFLDYSFIRR